MDTTLNVHSRWYMSLPLPVLGVVFSRPCCWLFPRSSPQPLNSLSYPRLCFRQAVARNNCQDGLQWCPSKRCLRQEVFRLQGFALRREARCFPRRCRSERRQQYRRSGHTATVTVVVRSKPQSRSPREALCPRRPHPRMVDLGHHPPRDAPPVDRADLLRLVIHFHYCLPLYPHFGHHASRRGGLGSSHPETLLCPPKICPVRHGLARAHHYHPGFRVRFQN